MNQKLKNTLQLLLLWFVMGGCFLYSMKIKNEFKVAFADSRKYDFITAKVLEEHWAKSGRNYTVEFRTDFGYRKSYLHVDGLRLFVGDTVRIKYLKDNPEYVKLED
jgi:hypothetical protein